MEHDEHREAAQGDRRASTTSCAALLAAPRRPRAEDRRAEGRRAGLPAGAREPRSCAASSPRPASCRRSGSPRCSARSSRPAARWRRRSASPTSAPRAPSASRRCASISAARSRRCRAPRSTRRSAARVGRRAVRRGAGGELDRRRGRPHARPAARHAAAHLRRGRAARAAEPAVPQRRALTAIKKHLLARAVARAVQRLAGAEPAAAPSACRWPPTPRRRSARRRRRARRRSPARRRASATASRCWRARIEDEPNNTTRFLVLGNIDPAPTGQRPHLARDVGREQARRGARAAHAARRARRQHDAHRVAPGARARSLWEYMFFIDVEGHQKDAARRRGARRAAPKAPFLKILGSYPVASILEHADGSLRAVPLVRALDRALPAGQADLRAGARDGAGRSAASSSSPPTRTRAASARARAPRSRPRSATSRAIPTATASS